MLLCTSDSCPLQLYSVLEKNFLCEVHPRVRTSQTIRIIQRDAAFIEICRLSHFVLSTSYLCIHSSRGHRPLTTRPLQQFTSARFMFSVVHFPCRLRFSVRTKGVEGKNRSVGRIWTVDPVDSSKFYIIRSTHALEMKI